MGVRSTTEETQAPREPARPADPSGPATTPSAMLLALQGAAGNRAVAAMMTGSTDQASTGTADPKNLAPRIPFLQPTGLMYQDPEPSAPQHRGGATWNLEFQMYGKPHAFTGLDDEGVI